MKGEMVDITTQDGVADAYLSRPPGQVGSHPGVLFIMDAFGLRPRIEEMVDRIAARGFVVLAPNVLYRAGRASNMELEQALEEAGVRYRSELYEGAAHGYTMSDTAAYDEAAAERHFTELFALLDRTIGG